MKKAVLFSLGLYLLLLVLTIDVSFIILGKEDLRLFSKPLLMPLLLGYYSKGRPLSRKRDLRIVSALLLSFLGDLFLLFPWGFVLGLGSFLLAHIFYILELKKRQERPYNFFYAVVLLLTLGAVLWKLWQELGDLKVPVLLYAGVLVFMALQAAATRSWKLFLGGALFVASDGILAFELFGAESTLGAVLVMLSYVGAQVLLVKGLKDTGAIST